ncbi:MAG: major facilitator superfamily domain-containing protein [Benniella sp.]|nr:MAG: major facilitator superfamily domain-containing protein [Benniella sp.]
MGNASTNDNVTVEVKNGHEREDIKTETNPNILNREEMTKREFHSLWAGILIQAFTFSFEICLIQGIMGYVTAYFTFASFGSVLQTISTILAVASVPFYTKVSDVFGRAGSLTFAIVSYLLGLTVEGTAQTFLQFSIGQILYGVGYTGIQALTQVLIADTSRLIDRGVMFALWDLGSAINIWVAQALIDPLTVPKEGQRPDKWRLGYLIMGVVSVVGAISLLAPVWYVQINMARRKVVKQQRCLLITLGMSLTLLPLILAKSYEGNWRNSKILGIFITGIVFFVLLAIWELKYTDRPIMSMKIWKNRTAFGGLMIVFLLKVMGNINWQYMTLYLVVSRNITYGQSFMLVRGFQLAWLVFQLVAGLLMRRFNTYRPFAWVGILLYIIGLGLMIPSRLPTASDAFVIASQAISGAGGGMAQIAASVIVTGVVHRNDVATVVGASQILVSFGSAVGNALAGGIWTQVLPTRLRARITSEYDEHLAMNDPLKYIPKLEPGMKAQLIEAYSDTQKTMTIIACGVAVFALVFVAMFQHVDLRQDQAAQDRIANGEDVSDQASKQREKEELH